MKLAHLLPLAMIVQSVLASGVYGATGDLRRAIYWAAAAALTAAVTF